MRALDFKRFLQYASLSQGIIFQVSRLDVNYGAFTIVGSDVMRGKPFHVSVISRVGKLFYCGDKGAMNIKSDSDRNIYLSVPVGSQVEASIFGNVLPIKTITAFPDDAVDVPEYGNA